MRSRAAVSVGLAVCMQQGGMNAALIGRNSHPRQYLLAAMHGLQIAA